MSAQHHHATHRHASHRHRARRFWLKQETILGTLAAFLAFATIYAYTGDADLIYPFAGALGMGAVIYVAAWMNARRKI